jgi:uncharacterized protein (TIGR02145 family)
MARRIKMVTVLFLITLTISAQGRQKRVKEKDNTAPLVEASEAPQYVIDIDSNIYKVVKIGKQVWMAENLKTTRLNDGTIIPFVPEDRQWIGLMTPALCWYNDGPFLNDSARYVSTYGFLYNWYAVTTGKLCPDGWHVPTENDWEALIDFLGIYAGYVMKESGTQHWTSTSPEITNESGFTALPGGGRGSDRDNPGTTHYFYAGEMAAWWSSSLFDKDFAIGAAFYAPVVAGRPPSLNHYLLKMPHAMLTTYGNSVRCLKTEFKDALPECLPASDYPCPGMLF